MVLFHRRPKTYNSFRYRPLARFYVVLKAGVRIAKKIFFYKIGLLEKKHLYEEIGTILRKDLGGLKGPLMKLGQTLAYVAEDLPEPIQLELKKLLVNSQPCDSAVVRNQIELQLGKNMRDVFQEFDDLPISTGSIGQVHRAKLLTGESVAVKVALPGIGKIVRSDLIVLRILLPILKLVIGVPNLNSVFLELSGLIDSETDLEMEKENIQTFQKICATDPNVVIPRVFPEFCTREVLTMEFIEGRNFFDFLRDSNQDQKNHAASVIWEFSGRSANRFLIFNGDPHPGNYIFLNDGRVAFIDFGFCKRWDVKFHDLWKQQTISGMANRLQEFTQASKEMGIVAAKGNFNYRGLMKAYQDYSYSVWSGPGYFQFDHATVNRHLRGIVHAHLNVRGTSFPKDLIVMTRLFCGLQTVMAMLNARIDKSLILPYLQDNSYAPTEDNFNRKIQRKLSKFTLDLLSEDKRISTVRHKVKVPRFALDERFEVVVCHHQKEFEMAFSLLHDSYVEQGLMNAQAEGIRCGLHSFLPETATILAKFNGLIVGTLSLNLDSTLGLPSDTEFKKEIDELRMQEGSRIVEVTGFAVDRDFRNQGNAVSLLLMKFLYVYSRDWLKGSHLVCAVRKKVQDFYKALFLFERRGPVVRYRAVNGVEGVFLSMDINKRHEDIFQKTFADCGNAEFAKFILSDDDRLKFPTKIKNLLMNFSMSPEVLRYFLLSRSRLLKKVSSEDVHTLVGAYKDIWGEHESLREIASRLGAMKNRARIYRMPVHVNSNINNTKNGLITFGVIKDLSSRGAFLYTLGWKNFSVGDVLTVKFNFLNEKWDLKAVVRWISSPGSNRSGSGVGISWEHSIEKFKLLGKSQSASITKKSA